jgi:glycosyltransferase involved in cell wall biosynthesis
MSFHIVLPRAMQLERSAEFAARHEAPRHAMWLLANELGAAVHEPDNSAALFTDKIRALVAPPESLWVLARRVRSMALPGDVIFCSGEAGGLQLAAACGQGRPRPRIAVFVHNIDRPRARFALRWWRMAQKVDLFLACSERQVAFLRQSLNLSTDRVRHVWDHTDTEFFSPGPDSGCKKRPVIVSVGLEQRDYKTLADATRDLDVDVRISGFSTDAAAMFRTFPEVLPDNMSRRFYEWPELVQLYRDADVVVVSCHQNKYAAGVQSLMEASACRRPVIATSTEGLKGYLDDSILAISPHDIQGMREAILQVLNDRPGAEVRAAKGYELALRRYNMDRYVTEISGAIRSLL